MMRRGNGCENLNHRRTNALVRYCPTCGEIVNDSISTDHCSEEKHASGRRRGSTYCMDCGKRLIMTT